MRHPWIPLLLVLAHATADTLEPPLTGDVTRPWPGADFWSNPLEDWQLSDGRLSNLGSGGDRKVVLLTAELSDEPTDFTFRSRIDQQSSFLQGDGYVGLEIGIRGSFDDYRDSAVYGDGLIAGINRTGRLFIGNPVDGDPKISAPFRNLTLELKGEPTGETYHLAIRVSDTSSGRLIATATRDGVHPSWLAGLAAVTASSQPATASDLTKPRPDKFKGSGQKRGGTFRFSFDQIALAGNKVVLHPERSLGPILWTTYTLNNRGDLSLLVQAAAFGQDESVEVTLKLADDELRYSSLDSASRTARFRVRRLDPGRDHPFEVRLGGKTWNGTIRGRPGTDRPLVVASMSCNDATGFPHNDLVGHIKAHDPDFITFHGDQIYEGIGGYGHLVDQRPNDRAVLSYLRKYSMHGWTWRELLRDTPSITIPDDHDVYHGNIWGAGGKLAEVSKGYGNAAQDSGGYKMSPEFVNAVHRTQTGNLPNPIDPAPCTSGISVYFTRLQYGPFDIAVLADRQFKSAPADLLPIARIENGWPKNPEFDPLTKSDVPAAELLGRRQEDFLARWSSDRQATEPFRIVVSQSPWLAPQTLPKEMDGDAGVPSLKVYPPGGYAPDDEPKPDFDTNGWPQAKRSAALQLVRKAGAVHLTGDQHLGSCGQYGLDSHDDGPWWLSSPAIANIWPRRWMPAIEGSNRRPGDPKWLGAFADGFGNKFTLHAVANPHDIDREPSRLFDRAPGYSITTWDKAGGTVRLENWPYWAGPDRPAPDNRPYPGWPITVDLNTQKRID